MPWTIKQTIEHEIKFYIPPRFKLPPNLGEPISPRVFTSTYFDTHHHRLGRLGLTLRKRVERAHGVWQLKIPTGGIRLELEIDSGSRNIPWEFYDLLMAFFRKQEAVQLGKLRTKRNGIHIHKNHAVIAEVVQDSVSLLKDKKVVYAFQELEIELQEGPESQLKPIRKALIHAGAQEMPLQPKIFQALQLPYPLSPKSSDASAIQTDLIQERLHSQFSQVLRHDPGTRLGRDSEALHQMRVATRRMRAILRNTRTFLEQDWTKHVRQEIKWIGSLLGEVRDWDVLLESLRKFFPEFSSSNEQPSFQSILNKFEDQRSKARARLLEGLRDDRYLTLLNDLEESLTHLPFQPSPLTIGDVVKNAFGKLENFVKNSDRQFPVPDLHRTRILLKRARYACELAEPLCGKHTKRFLQQAKSLQSLLGQHHDAMVAEERLLALKQHSRGTGMAFVTGLMVERLRTLQSEVYQHIPNQWKKIEKQGKKL